VNASPSSVRSQRVATVSSNPRRSAKGFTNTNGEVVAITRRRPAARCSSIAFSAPGSNIVASSSAAASMAAATVSTLQPAAARLDRRAGCINSQVSPNCS
jgi:hypothetical protein